MCAAGTVWGPHVSAAVSQLKVDARDVNFLLNLRCCHDGVERVGIGVAFVPRGHNMWSEGKVWSDELSS